MVVFKFCLTVVIDFLDYHDYHDYHGNCGNIINAFYNAFYNAIYHLYFIVVIFNQVIFLSAYRTRYPYPYYSNGSRKTGKEVKQVNLLNLYLTHVIPDIRKPQSLCESIMAPRNDVVPDIYSPTASNALRISDDTVPGIGEVTAEK